MPKIKKVQETKAMDESIPWPIAPHIIIIQDLLKLIETLKPNTEYTAVLKARKYLDANK